MRNISFALVLLAAACGSPDTPNLEPIQIRSAWASPTPGGVSVSAGYLEISNATDQDDRLIAASSPRADRVEIHDMVMDGPIMRMRPVEALSIPAGETVTFAPGGMHLMFMGVVDPFAEGENIPVTLSFERAGDIEATLPVRRSASSH